MSMLDHDLQHPSISAIERNGELPQHDFDAEDERAYTIDEMRYERQREEMMLARAEKGI